MEKTPEGVVAFEFMPDAGEADADAGTSLFIVYNALGISREILLPEGKWQLLTDGRRFKIREKDQELEALGEREGSVRAEKGSVTILRK